MVRLNCCAAGWPVLSVTITVKVTLPAPVGVPASRLLLPAGAPAERGAGPGGSCLEATGQVQGATPPLRKK